MIIAKTDPVGIDRVIDLIQKSIDAPLSEKWADITIYPRVYKMHHKDESRLEHYVGNGDYEAVLSSDKNKIFFTQGDSPSVSRDGMAVNDLNVFCIVNIDDTNISLHRADEEVHMDLVTELTNVPGLEITGVEYGLDNIRRLVEDPFEFGNFKYSDIQPYHVFAVRTQVNYEITHKNC